MGWKYQNVIRALEAKRKAKEFFKVKKVQRRQVSSLVRLINVLVANSTNLNDAIFSSLPTLVDFGYDKKFFDLI